MAQILALEWLFTTVRDQFIAEGIPAENRFGWRVPAQLTPTANIDRIAWVPGDPTGIAGTMGPPRNPGGNPRSLGTYAELFYVEIQAADITDLENELAQWRKVRILRDQWYRAVYHAAYGIFEIQAEQWLTDRLERRYGAALRVLATIDAMVPDITYPSIPPGTDPNDPDARATAVIDVHELDLTETITIDPSEEPTP